MSLDDRAAAPLVVAAEMGYGHLRAALPLAEALGVPLQLADREPLAGPEERVLWDRVRGAYELTSRLSQVSLGGGPLRWLLDQVTDIPGRYSERDLTRPTSGVRFVERQARRGLGRGLVAALRQSGRPLLTTFYVPALIADQAGLENDLWCVVTDTDANRVWAPSDAARTRLRYLVPTRDVQRRLVQFGVPADRITCTGFPLPHELVGGPDYPALKRNLAGRLVRLDPHLAFRSESGGDVAAFLGPLPAGEEGQPPLVTFAVGGAGAQAELARAFLPSLRPALLEGRLRLALVAGAKASARDALQEALVEARLVEGLDHGVELLHEPDLGAYVRRMNELLARTDVLWTKPSELTFYAALGLPIVCAPPVGVHERRNRRWVREAGAGVKQRAPEKAGAWLLDLITEGQLAAAAWSGYVRLPKGGLYRILETVAARAALRRYAS
jgi:hypothetical protein